MGMNLLGEQRGSLYSEHTITGSNIFPQLRDAQCSSGRPRSSTMRVPP